MKAILSLILFIPFFIFSQEDEKLEREASFPGGYGAMKEFLSNNVVYPEVSLEVGDQGTVILEFVVNKDGSIEQVKVLQGVSSEIDEEAIRVVSIMPNWIPGIYKGELVRVRCKIPINFGFLDDEKKKIIDYPQKIARFPGGNRALNTYLKKNSIHSFVIIEGGKDGEIIIEFVVNRDGTIEQVELIKGTSEEVNQAAINLVKEMPKWKPAKHYRSKVRSRVRLPINFELTD